MLVEGCIVESRSPLNKGEGLCRPSREVAICTRKSPSAKSPRGPILSFRIIQWNHKKCVWQYHEFGCTIMMSRKSRINLRILRFCYRHRSKSTVSNHVSSFRGPAKHLFDGYYLISDAEVLELSSSQAIEVGSIHKAAAPRHCKGYTVVKL